MAIAGIQDDAKFKGMTFEMAGDCYFFDQAKLIVNPSKETETPNIKLTDMGAYITQFVVQKIRMERVADILADTYQMEREPEDLALNAVRQLVLELYGRGLIKLAEPPPRALSNGQYTTDGDTTTTAVAVYPFIVPKK
jgi:hypothetical protein